MHVDALDRARHEAGFEPHQSAPRTSVLSWTTSDASTGSIPMLDLIMLAIGLGFFALSVGYAYACDRL
jgi:hypothetical protein